jgi:ornithine cyclodeaminase/alanine dehydrogenase-like protein (mu-crystallin family)
MEPGTLVLARSDVETLLDLDTCISAVDSAFRRHAEGAALGPGVLGVPADGGGFHVKAAGLRMARVWFAAKTNANFPGNARRGLPSIQGVVALYDGVDGRLLALVDSMSITRLRTAAATAVAARHLARRDAAVVTLVGCGAQGATQVEALARVLPLRRVHAVDSDPLRAATTAAALAASLGVEATAAGDLSVVRASDVCVTCTPARRWIVGRDHVRPGTFVAGVGADSEDKQELEPALLAGATVVADLLQQCLAIGELHHAVAAGVLRPSDVHAELADLVTGARPGRTRADEVTVFDSTGTALQDVAATAAVYERACAAGRGLRVDLAA